MVPASSLVKSYFEKQYLDREGWRSSFLRSRALERSAIISAWLPPLAGKSLCDVGCGDGDQIRRILSTGNVPSRLVLQDLSPTAVHRAKQALAGCGSTILGSVGDAFVDGFGGPHHVVIATGVTDYYPDWDRVLGTLLKCTLEVLIVDFPRKWRLRNIPRRMWLRRNGLDFNAATHRGICDLMCRHACSFEITRSTYNWIVRITKNLV